MKAIIYKILLFFRDLFLHLHVVVKLHIGRGKVSKEAGDCEESQKGKDYEKESNS